jgi:hypothetical protein
LAEYGKYLEKWGQDRTGAEIQKEMDSVDKRIGEIDKMSLWDQPIAYAKLIKDNPFGVGNYALTEVIQEGVPVASALIGAGLAIAQRCQHHSNSGNHQLGSFARRFGFNESFTQRRTGRSA